VDLTVPDLHDDVIALRPPQQVDVDAITAACQDPEIPRFTRVPSPYARKDAVEHVERVTKSWAEGGTEAVFGVTDATSGELLGSIGVLRLDEHPDCAEIGYWVGKASRRRGIATRAVRLVSRWAVGDLGVRRLELMTRVENVASQGVAARAGFTREGVLRSYMTHGCGRVDVVMFSLLPSDLDAAG
jgi:RimJ/RimL family protein N-acetyltransferase